MAEQCKSMYMYSVCTVSIMCMCVDVTYKYAHVGEKTLQHFNHLREGP